MFTKITKRIVVIVTIFAAALPFFLYGCGSGSTGTAGPAVSRAGGRVQVAIAWPARQAAGGTRYIPSYAQSLYFELYLKSQPANRYKLTVNRPDDKPSTQTAQFDTLLPSGDYTLAGVARVEKGGLGETVASAATDVTVQPNGVTTVDLTLNSTIRTITVGSGISVAPNTDVPIPVTAKDPDGRILVLPPSALTFSIASGPSGGTLSGQGVFRAATPGTYHIRVEEPVTHVGAETDVVCVSYNISGIVKNRAGQSVSGASVVSSANGTLVTAIADASGRYQMTLPAGTHILSASAAGLIGASTPLVVADQPVVSDIVLGAANSGDPTAAPVASIGQPSTNLTTGTAVISGSFINTDGSGIVQIINGDETLVSAAGGFASTLVLRLGVNTIQYRSSNIIGATLTPPVTINYAPDSTLAFRVTMTWDGSGDVDLWTADPSGNVSSYGNPSIASGVLDVDNTSGFGPENFTAKSGIAGRFRVGVNAYGGATGRKATINVTVLSGPNAGITRSFGPYSFTESSAGGGTPITGSTGAWWRPCDIVVAADGSIQITAPNADPFPNSGRATLVPKQHTAR